MYSPVIMCLPVFIPLCSRFMCCTCCTGMTPIFDVLPHSWPIELLLYLVEGLFFTNVSCCSSMQFLHYLFLWHHKLDPVCATLSILIIISSSAFHPQSEDASRMGIEKMKILPHVYSWVKPFSSHNYNAPAGGVSLFDQPPPHNYKAKDEGRERCLCFPCFVYCISDRESSSFLNLFYSESNKKCRRLSRQS